MSEKEEDPNLTIMRLLTKGLIEDLQEREETRVVDGEAITIKVRPSAALYNVARQLMKDQGVEQRKVPGNDIDKLSKLLPEFDDDDADFKDRRTH